MVGVSETVCLECAGEGIVECELCAGSGFDDESPDDQDFTCPECNGTGEDECSECGGSGEVEP